MRGSFDGIIGLHCEGFGCLGIGLIYFYIGLVLIPVIFGVLGFLFSPGNRLRQSIYSLLISLVVMAISLWVFRIWNEMDIRKTTEKARLQTLELYKKEGIPSSQ